MNGYEYPSRLKWDGIPDDFNYCCVTIPNSFFEPSASNLSQLKNETVVQRKYSELLFFLINCFNNPKIGKQSEGSSDLYISLDESSYQKGILLDGEKSCSILPKYKIYLEYLTKDISELIPYDDNIEGISKVFSEDNFCGIRFWFIFFDPEFDIHNAIKQGIYKNQECAIIKQLKKEKWNNNGIKKYLKARREEDNEGMNSGNKEVNTGLNRRNKSKYMGGFNIDWRAICERVNIKSKDIEHYHLGVNNYKKFGTLVDLINGELKCSVLDQLNDKYYDIENNNPNSNPLHVYHWGRFGKSRRFFRKRVGNPFLSISDEEHDDQVFYEYFISEEQNKLENYFIGDEESDINNYSFRFPFSNLTWGLKPEHCSIKEILNRDFPWKKISRFDALYQEIVIDYNEKLKNMKEEKKRERLLMLQEENKGIKLTINGQTEEEELTMLKLNKLKENFYNENNDNQENYELEDELMKYLDENNYILNQNDIRNKKSINNNNEIIKREGITIFEELGNRNKNKHKKLIHAREICPERYSEIMKLYKEEVLAEFVKVYKADTEGLSNSVKSILLWFENEDNLIRTDLDTRAKYKSLALEFNTMDPSIGRNNYNFVSNQLYLDALIPVANIHRNFFSALKSAYYVYIMPGKAKEDIGTSIKPAIFQLGAPGTSKSFLLELMKLVLIDGTITNLDGFTDKALQTGDNNLTDVIALIDEMGSTFTQDPQKMQGDQLERYRNMKTYLTAGKHQRIVCRYEDNNRETETIKTNISMCVIGCANSLHTGSDASLYDRGIIMISNPIKRADKDPISLMCTTYSDVTNKNREVLFLLKHRVTQYLFCEIAKMLGTYVIPVKVNIEIGKILKDNTIRLLSQIYVGLDKKVRNSQKLLVNMYAQAILDAIDVCYFSEASPYMIREVSGKIRYAVYSHKQVQNIMPALCLSEDSAIREITSWLQYDLYNDFAYRSLVLTSQKMCNFKFYKLKQPEDLHPYTIQYMKENNFQHDKETYKKVKSMISKSIFFGESVKESFKEYSDYSGDTVDSISSTKYQLRMKKEKIGIKERDTFYYDTNYIQIPCNSEANFKKKWYDSVIQTTHTTQDVIDVAYKKAKEIIIMGKPRRVYKQAADNNRTPVLYDEEEDDEYYGFYKSGKYYNFKALKFEMNVNNPSKSKMLISVEFLYNYSFNNILNLALQSMSHKHTRERFIVINNLVENTPHLYQIFRLIPNENITLTTENPTHMNKYLSNVVFSQTDIQNKRSMCKSREKDLVKYDFDLEKEIFINHAIDCGIDPKDNHKLNMFIPSVINETITAFHNSDINLKRLKKIDYPMTFVAGINKKRDIIEKNIMDQYRKAGLLRLGDFNIIQDVNISEKKPKKYIDLDDDIDMELDLGNKKSDKIYLEKIDNTDGKKRRIINEFGNKHQPKKKRRKKNRKSDMIPQGGDIYVD